MTTNSKTALLTLLVKTLTPYQEGSSWFWSFPICCWSLLFGVFGIFFLSSTVTYISELNLFRFVWQGSCKTTKSGANKIRYITTLTIEYGQAPQVSKSHVAKSATVSCFRNHAKDWQFIHEYSRFYTSLLWWSEDFWSNSSTFTLSHRWLSRACYILIC